MNKKVRLALVIILAAIFLASTVCLIYLIRRNYKEAAFYEDSRDSFVQVSVAPPRQPVQPEPGQDMERETDVGQVDSQEVPVDQVMQIDVDFAALLEAGKDVKAWIYLPGTNISYPVVQGADNRMYERHDYMGAYAWAGSIFMDYRNASDFSDRSTVIYGHNIKNDTMFSQLQKYNDSTFLSEQPVFYIVTPDEQQTYEVCAVLITDVLVVAYTFSFADDAVFSQYLQTIREDAILTAGSEPTAADQLVVLSTCTNRQETERLVVIGRRMQEDTP